VLGVRECLRLRRFNNNRREKDTSYDSPPWDWGLEGRNEEANYLRSQRPIFEKKKGEREKEEKKEVRNQCREANLEKTPSGGGVFPTTQLSSPPFAPRTESQEVGGGKKRNRRRCCDPVK